MDILANIIAFIALVVSCWVAYSQNKISKKIAQKTFNQKFFDDIISDYIINQFPVFLDKLKFGANNLEDTGDQFGDMICEMLSKMIFYKYFECDFYENIKKILMNIEDKVYDLVEPRLTTTQFDYYNHQLDECINTLYRELKNYYSDI